jgi:hypothetical protein
MSLRRLSAAALVAAIALPAGAGMAERDRFSAQLDREIATLSNIVLRERVSRYSQTGKKVCMKDSFETTVNVVDGVEQYSEVRGRSSGIWSFGEAITMLRTTREELRGQEWSGNPGEGLRYRCAAESRRWFAIVGATTYWLDFDASVDVSPQTGEIARIVWTSASLPRGSGIEGIEWTIEFRTVEVAGQVCTIPSRGLYKAIRRVNGYRADWNVVEFNPVGRYGSEATVRFEP